MSSALVLAVISGLLGSNSSDVPSSALPEVGVAPEGAVTREEPSSPSAASVGVRVARVLVSGLGGAAVGAAAGYLAGWATLESSCRAGCDDPYDRFGQGLGAYLVGLAVGIPVMALTAFGVAKLLGSEGTVWKGLLGLVVGGAVAAVAQPLVAYGLGVATAGAYSPATFYASAGVSLLVPILASMVVFERSSAANERARRPRIAWQPIAGVGPRGATLGLAASM